MAAAFLNSSFMVVPGISVLFYQADFTGSLIGSGRSQSRQRANRQGQLGVTWPASVDPADSCRHDTIHRLGSFVVETFRVSCVFLDVIKLRADAKAVLEELHDVGMFWCLHPKHPRDLSVLKMKLVVWIALGR